MSIVYLGLGCCSGLSVGRCLVGGCIPTAAQAVAAAWERLRTPSFGVSTATITSGLREVASAKTPFKVPTSLYGAMGVHTLVASERAAEQQLLAYAKALAGEAAAG